MEASRNKILFQNLLIYMLDASKRFVAIFLVISNPIANHSGGKGTALAINNGLQALSKPFLFISQYVPYNRTFITYESSKEKPRHFLTYYNITGYNSAI